jgi:hypothetical protein
MIDYTNQRRSSTMPGQNATNPDTASSSFALSPQQETAVNLLAIGNTVTEAAEKIGVARQTLSSWLNQNRAFQAALNWRRQELFESQIDRLRALAVKAASVLDGAMNSGNVNATIAVLKAAGLNALQPPEGPITPEDAEIAAKERENAKRHRALSASIAARCG